MIRIIINDIYIAFCEYIYFAIGSSILLFSILYGLRSLYLFKGGVVKSQFTLRGMIPLFLLYVYLFLLISITILSRQPGSRTDVNMELFSTISCNLSENVYPIENILLFIPFGLLLPFVNSRFKKALWTLVLGASSSLLIEIIQLVTQRGYFQTDDVLMNILGTLLGFAIFTTMARVKPVNGT